MTYGKVVLARPVKISDGDFDFYTPYTAPFATGLNIDTGVYADLGSFLYAVETQIKLVLASFNFSFSINSEGDLLLSGQAGASWKIVFSDETSILPIIGYESTPIATGTSALSADNRSTHVWNSTYIPNTLDAWRIRSGGQFSGAVSRNGYVSGVAVGDVLYEMDYPFVFEPQHKVLIEEARSTYEAANCLQQFCIDSLTVAPLSETTVNPKGFWIYYDSSDFDIVKDVTNNIGISHNYSSSPDVKVLASLSPGYDLGIDPATAKHRQYYNVTLPVHTVSFAASDYS